MPRKPTTVQHSRLSPRPDLIGDLQRLGFSEYEGRTYISLLQHSPATAYEISKQSGLPRANTYGALENLAKKRAVQPVSENPVRYVPITPEVLLERLATEVNEVCQRLKERLEKVDGKDSSGIVWSIEGQSQIESKINELIEGAEQHVWIKASTDVLRRHVVQLKRAATRGVALMFVVFGSDTEFLRLGPRCAVYLHEGNGVRVGRADNLFTIAIDYRIALTASIAHDLTGAYTTNLSVVRMAETLIRHDIYMAEMMTAFGEQIEARFGPGLVSLRRKLFSPEQLQALEANFNAATVRNADPVASRIKRARGVRTTSPS